MTIEAKICGLRSREALACAVDAGAAYVGFVFYPPSPRSVTLAEAADLAAQVPAGVIRVGLVVEAEDAVLDQLLATVPLDMLQCHGQESPARVAEIRSRSGLPVMKAIRVAEAADLDPAGDYAAVCDRLLFDAKPPKDLQNALPGGNGLAFNWRLLEGRDWGKPWMLAGGLAADTVAEAVQISGARAVDVSSGVESAPGIKDPEKIRAFMAAIKQL